MEFAILDPFSISYAGQMLHLDCERRPSNTNFLFFLLSPFAHLPHNRHSNHPASYAAAATQKRWFLHKVSCFGVFEFWGIVGYWTTNDERRIANIRRSESDYNIANVLHNSRRMHSSRKEPRHPMMAASKNMTKQEWKEVIMNLENMLLWLFA